MSKKESNWRVEQVDTNAHVIHIDFPNKTEEQWFLLRSDVHHDNIHCNVALETRHLDEATERGAGIIDYGDLFDVMQSSRDKRASKFQIRPEHAQTDDYFGAVLNDAVKFYAPYAKNIAMLSYGNHETAILKHNNLDLIQQLAARLSEKIGTRVPTGGYSGFIRFRASAGKNRIGNKTMFYHHGSGGGGIVTKGVIQNQRRQAFVDADIIATGHIHEKHIHCDQRHKLNESDRHEIKDVWHVCTPGYKGEYDDGKGGWHVERGAPPKPLGAAWLRFYIEGGSLKVEASFAS